MDNQTSVSIKFTNSVTGEKKLERYAETLKQINGIIGAMDKGKIKQISKQLDNQSASAKKVTGETQQMAKSINTAFSVGKIAQFGKMFQNLVTKMSSFTKKSADFAENWNLLDVAFNGATKEAEKFVNTMTEMYGLDESWGYRTVGLFKQLSNAMGLTGEVGTDLAKTLTQLSVDLSSLYNVDVDDAVSKLQSALAGQTKPVRFFGADITQNTLQLTLETHGIDKAVTDLSYAEKRLLIVASILEQTEEAQGDWGRTIESTANQMRIFQQQTERLSRAIGDVFAPVMKTILPIMNAVLMVITELISMFASWLALLVGYEKEDYFAGTSESVSDLADGLGVATENAKKLKSGLRGFDKLNNITTPTQSGASAGGGTGVDASIMDLYSKASQSYLENLEKVNMKATQIRDKIMEWLGFTKLIDEETGDISFKFEKLTSGTVLGALAVGGTVFIGVTKIVGLLSKLASIGGTGGAGLLAGVSGGTVATVIGVAGALGILVYAIYDLYQSNEDFANSINAKWAEIQSSMQPIVENLTILFENLKVTYEETLKPLFEELYNTLQVIAQALIEILFPVINDFILPALNLFIQCINDIITVLNQFWNEHGEKIFNELRKAIEGAVDTFKKAWETVVKPIIDKIIETITKLWDEHLKPLAEKIANFIGETIELILLIWNNFLKPVLDWIVANVGPKVEKVINFLIDKLGKLLGWVSNILDGIMDALRGVIKFLTGVFTGDWKKAWEGVKDIFKGIWDALATIIKAPLNLIIGAVEGLVNKLIDGFNVLKKAINKISFDVPDWIPIIGGQKWGFNIALSDHVSIPRLKVGMDFVPNDYFPAFLDYGERVLTKEENADYNKGIIRGEQVGGQPMNATFIIQVGEEEIARKVLNDLQDMAKSNGEPITIG